VEGHITLVGRNGKLPLTAGWTDPYSASAGGWNGSSLGGFFADGRSAEGMQAPNELSAMKRLKALGWGFEAAREAGRRSRATAGPLTHGAVHPLVQQPIDGALKASGKRLKNFASVGCGGISITTGRPLLNPAASAKPIAFGRGMLVSSSGADVADWSLGIETGGWAVINRHTREFVVSRSRTSRHCWPPPPVWDRQGIIDSASRRRGQSSADVLHVLTRITVLKFPIFVRIMSPDGLG
jgi:hypothetical protein